MLFSYKNIIKGSFVKRVSRFSAAARVKGEEKYVYVPNPGRLNELLFSGAKVFLTPSEKPLRKTSYDLILVSSNSTLVSIDSRIPNKLIHEALQNKKLAELSGYEEVKSEVMFGSSRLDFLLIGLHKKVLIEVKSVTLVKEGIAFFPDAVTSRGVRHINELIRAKKEGVDSVIIFVVQRADANAFSANAVTDPAFALALDKAGSEGVTILSYICHVSLKEIRLYKKIPFL